MSGMVNSTRVVSRVPSSQMSAIEPIPESNSITFSSLRGDERSNKYSRESKPRDNLNSDIRRDLKEGKNAYDMDDPLQSNCLIS